MISVLVIVRGFYHGTKEVQKLQRKRKTRIVGVAELGGSDPSPRQTSSEVWQCAKVSDVDEGSPQLRKSSSEPDCLDLPVVVPFATLPNKRDFRVFSREDNVNANSNGIQTVLDTTNGYHDNGYRDNGYHDNPHGPTRLRNTRSAWTDEAGVRGRGRARNRDAESTVRSIPDRRVVTR